MEPKALAALILKSRDTESTPNGSDIPDPYDDAAHEIMSAMRKDDSKALRMALRDFVSICRDNDGEE